MNQIKIIFLVLILASGCTTDKKSTSENSTQQNTAPNQLAGTDSDSKSKDAQDLAEASKSQFETSTNLDKKEEKIILKQVEEYQKKYEEEIKQKAEANRKASKYKNESCDILIQKIEKAVEKAISDPDDKVNLNFLYEIHLDQTHADCKKMTDYGTKYQDLMKKWDES